LDYEAGRVARRGTRYDAVVVIRGGANSLSAEAVERSAERNMVAFGFLGLSVFLCDADLVAETCRSIDELQRYGQIRRSTVARLQTAGFPLLATGDAPHFDIVLPDLAPTTLARLGACFDHPVPNPGRGG
jgi:hypothetical protein